MTKQYTEEQKAKRSAYTRAWLAARPGYHTALNNSSEERKQKHRDQQKKWIKAHPEYDKQWRLRNIDRERATERKQKRAYRLKHPERVRAWNKADRERRKDKVKAAAKVYYKKNAARICSTTKLWRENNRDRKRALHRAYKKRHPEKNKEQQHRRRCKMLAVGIEDCTAKIKLLHQERFCHWCCAQLTPETREIDHVIPISRGGRHIPDNLVAACQSCNRSKNDRLISEWTWKEAA